MLHRRFAMTRRTRPMNKIAMALPVLALATALPLPSYADKQAAQQTAYIQTNLVFGLTGTGAVQDTNLLNPWGVTFAPAGPFIVADNGAGAATSYSDADDPRIAIVQLRITIGGGQDVPLGGTGLPTGDAVTDATNSREFLLSGVTGGGASVGEAALFVFAEPDGSIVGCNPEFGPANPGFQPVQ